MRYGESRARSAELLRLVVSEMGRQPAPMHPDHYRLWYEHFAGINPALSVAINAKRDSGQALSDLDVQALVNGHIATRDARAVQSLQLALVLLIEQIGAMAENTIEGASLYGTSLATCAKQLRGDRGVESIGDIVQVLIAETESMRTSTGQLGVDLGQIRSEMHALRTQVATLSEEALTDALTGLHNRRGFERAVETLAGGAGLVGASLLMGDVDHFKKINDTYGHLIGDRVLAAIGRLLKARVKGRDLVARWGGEEFVVLLPDTLAADARNLAEQIRADTARGRIKRIDREEYIGSVTISIGVAEASADDTLAALIERADGALYRAKAEGRNRTVLAAPWLGAAC
jgi:diguanylate cyclase